MCKVNAHFAPLIAVSKHCKKYWCMHIASCFLEGTSSPPQYNLEIEPKTVVMFDSFSTSIKSRWRDQNRSISMAWSVQLTLIQAVLDVYMT